MLIKERTNIVGELRRRLPPIRLLRYQIMANIITNKIETVTSMEVAEMIGKEHSKTLRDIRRYIEQMNESKIGFVNFFIESTYKDAKGEERPCYLVTKKGCEFIAHKLTGIKGTEFTAKYINRFHYKGHVEHLAQIGDIRQRGDIGGSAKKVGKRIKELERLYGIQNGGNRGNQYVEAEPNNSVLATQSDLATQLGISVDTLQNYKMLADMIPELEELLRDVRRYCVRIRRSQNWIR